MAEAVWTPGRLVWHGQPQPRAEPHRLPCRRLVGRSLPDNTAPGRGAELGSRGGGGAGLHRLARHCGSAVPDRPVRCSRSHRLRRSGAQQHGPGQLRRADIAAAHRRSCRRRQVGGRARSGDRQVARRHLPTVAAGERLRQGSGRSARHCRRRRQAAGSVSPRWGGDPPADDRASAGPGPRRRRQERACLPHLRRRAPGCPLRPGRDQHRPGGGPGDPCRRHRPTAS
jgi:hypothetical protein